MKTKRDIVIADWRGHGPLTIPSGTRVSGVISEPRHHGQPEQCFVEDFARLLPAKSIELHDATYYGIRVDVADCEEG